MDPELRLLREGTAPERARCDLPRRCGFRVDICDLWLPTAVRLCHFYISGKLGLLRDALPTSTVQLWDIVRSPVLLGSLDIRLRDPVVFTLNPIRMYSSSDTMAVMNGSQLSNPQSVPRVSRF